uniref:Serine protease K12H4.7 n=1 Tax=Ditylenchus dipsaci TaxID=166011 RepID=A0A915D5H4_9BILA
MTNSSSTFSSLSFCNSLLNLNKVNVGPFATKGGGIADVCKIFQDSSLDDYGRMKNYVNYIVPLMTNSKKFYGLPNNYTLFVQSFKTKILTVITPTLDLGTGSVVMKLDISIPPTMELIMLWKCCTQQLLDKLKAKGVYGSSGAVNVTNALITIGSTDPWKTVGVSTALDSTATLAVIEDYGQAADLSPATSADDYKLTFVRNLALKNIKKWVAGSNSSKTRRSLNKSRVVKDEAEEHRLEASKNKNKPKRQKFRRHHTFSEELVRRFGSSEDHSKKVKHSHIMQVLDHFNDSNNQGVDKWEQYFYRNDAYASDDGPVFLMMGGESAIEAAELTQTFMATLAKEFKADMYTLEHRFYGESQPTDFDLSVNNLQYLTFDQALADAAVFVESVKKSTGKNNTWIVLVDLTLECWLHGSVSNRSYQYMQVVDNATRLLGPKGCAENSQALFNLLQEMLTTIRGRKTLSSAFGFCQDWAQDFVEPKDMQSFLEAFTGVLAGTVQYDDHKHQELQKACDMMTNIYGELKKIAKSSTAKSPEMKILMRDFHAQLPSYKIKEEQQCWNVSYYAEVEYLQNEQPDQTDFRSYEWQSCLQMGISESTDIGYSIFNSALPTNYYTDLCSLAYGKQFTRDVLDAGQRRTNAVYGGQDNFTGTNVVFVNGSEDPWHPPSVYNPVGANNTVIFIDATSHCYDMYPPMRSDPKRITEAHAHKISCAENA